MRLIAVLGARPNVIKVASLLPALHRAGIEVDVAFTGSREAERLDCEQPEPLSFYGVEMLPPRWSLDVGTGTDALLTGRAMLAFEELFADERPQGVLVVGDISTTLAAAISAAKAGLPVVHLEAGLRAGSLALPDEINRMLISQVAAMHLVPTERALENLEDEGVEPERIHFVGSMLAESVLTHLDKIVSLEASIGFGLHSGSYILGSFHRPENLADPLRLEGIAAGLARAPLPVLVPDRCGLGDALELHGYEVPAAVRIIDAVPYDRMLALIRDAAAVITDSGGVQEESCVVGTPCVTVRDVTELDVTIEAGATRLADAEPEAIRGALVAAMASPRGWVVPKRWDRAVSERVVRALKRGIMPLA